VVEKGALLSHGATLAREYGIPAVMNINGLFQVVAEGVPLRVDGNQGVISVQLPAESAPSQDLSAQVPDASHPEEGFTSA
jgi:pyruvate,water dikinase